MKRRLSLPLAGLTLLLWVMPSVGTQGMGTIGQQVVHPDSMLVDPAPADRAAARDLLLRADRSAETALGF